MNVDLDDVLGTIGLARRSEAAGAGSFLLGLGVGMLGGIAAAILLTPYSGNETREKLLRASEGLGRTMSSKVDEMRTRRNELGQSGRIDENTRVGV